MSTAHERKEHPLTEAYAPAWSTDGDRVYVICGWQGCPHRLQLTADQWQREAARRSRQAELAARVRQGATVD